MAVNELVEAVIHVVDVLEEGGHDFRLVFRTYKVVREATSGETRGDLGVLTFLVVTFLVATCRAADASDPRT